MSARTIRSIVLLMLVLVIAGCGSESDGAAPQTVTVLESAEPAAPETVTVVETSPAPANTATPPPTDPPSAAGKIEVPSVVGLDHQLAQDTMQAAGLYNLAEEDATGAGRMLLWDRNWTVVSQDPPAGTMVNDDQTIVLRSKKDDE